MYIRATLSVNHGVNIRYDGNKSPRHIPKNVYVSWSCPMVRVTIVTYVHTMVHTKCCPDMHIRSLICVSGHISLIFCPDTHIKGSQIYT